MEKLYGAVIQIALQYKSITKLVLFGSRARGDNKSNSDIDLAVYTKFASFEQQSCFRNDIDELDTLYKFDIIFISENTDKQLLLNIEKEGVVLLDKLTTKSQNLNKAVTSLQEAIKQYKETSNDVVRDGVIQRFEFSVELAWKATKEYLEDQGYIDINGPKPVMREAFSMKLIDDQEKWITILNDRNLTSHIYDENTAGEICERIISCHADEIKKLAEKLNNA